METKAKNVFLATAVAAVLLVAAVGSASANCVCDDGFCNNVGRVMYQCGETVTEDCTFQANMGFCPNNAAGLYVGAHGITIDGQGFRMWGTRGPFACAGATDQSPAIHSGIANFGNWDDVVITDLEIDEFCTGIALGNANNLNVDNNTVQNCSIHDNGDLGGLPPASMHGIHMVATNNCTIRDNTLHDNSGVPYEYNEGGNCIFLYGTADVDRGTLNLIQCNHCYDHSESGVFLKNRCFTNNIECNNLSYNSGYGIELIDEASGNFVGTNIMTSNGLGGLQTDSTGNIIVYNTISNNGGVGIDLLAGSAGNSVEDNYACGHIVDINDIFAGNVGANNTGNACPAGWCPYNCANTATVYYDQDWDDDCSRNIPYALELLACGNLLDVGWCNHKGMFNANAATGGPDDHCWGVCNWISGNDPNDCNPDVVSDNPVPSVPELATVVLFGVGLLMLVGYVGLRKRKSESK